MLENHSVTITIYNMALSRRWTPTYDPCHTISLLIIGAGQAGIALVTRTAAAGLKTAIVENELVGGECHYWHVCRRRRF